MLRATVLIGALLAINAPAAHAGSITSATNRYIFDAAPGETNNLEVTQEISNCGALVDPCIAIEDEIPITHPSRWCAHELGNANWVVCPFVDNVTVNAGDGNDKVAIFDPFSAVVDGGDGNDTIGGASGNDQISGGPGNDDIAGWNGNDTVSGGPGDDLLESQYSYGAPVSTGSDSLSGGDGFDKLQYYQRSDALNVSLDGAANDGAPGENDNVLPDIESVQTGAGDDTIVGDGSPNTLNGDFGDDTISGRGGNDDISGSSGNDKLYGESGNDTIHGFGDNDLVDGGPGQDNLFGDEANDEIFARDGSVDSIGCGIGADTAHVDYNDIVAADPGRFASRSTAEAPPPPPPPPPRPLRDDH